MTNFKMDALVSWHGVMPNELIEFEATEPRRVRLAFMANAPVEVWASYPAEPGKEQLAGYVAELHDVLVGYGSGQFETEFTTHGTTFLRVLAPEDTSIFARGFAPDMMVPESAEEVFTSIMPRERRNTEFDRMVMWTKLNEARRDAQLAEAIAGLKAHSKPLEAHSKPLEAPSEVLEQPQQETIKDGA